MNRTPLVFSYILPTTRADWGLSPVRNVRRQAHPKKASDKKYSDAGNTFPLYFERRAILSIVDFLLVFLY